MSHSPIFEVVQPAGAILGEYSGVETPSRFATPQEEFDALSSCAVYDLSWRAKLKIAGADRVRWLNGMVTNNIKQLQPERGNYSFVLTPQGKILGDLHAYNLGDYFVIDTDRSQVENLMATFRRYIIMDKVEIIDISDSLTAIGIQGPGSRTVLEQSGLRFAALEAGQIVEVSWQDAQIQITRISCKKFEAYELWSSPEIAPRLWSALLAAGGKPVGTETLERFRVMMGIPRYGVDIRDRELPQETGQEQALNFTKGCYIGQEIVERIRSRGAVHRQLTGFRVEGEKPSPGDKIMADGKEVGEITSVAVMPFGETAGKVIALGYLRREFTDKALAFAGGTLAVTKLPFTFE